LHIQKIKTQAGLAGAKVVFLMKFSKLVLNKKIK